MTVGLPGFAGQLVEFALVEQSAEMNRFVEHFSQITDRIGVYSAGQNDFAFVDPARERRRLQQDLRKREYYDGETDGYFPEYTVPEANYIAQRYARYRMIVLSNFLTISGSVQSFEEPLRALFTDLRAGSAAILLGARGQHYKQIYDDFLRLAQQCGLRPLRDVPEELGRDNYEFTAPIIKQAQYRVFSHLAKRVGDENLELSSKHPDYWSPDPHPKKRVEFAMRVYRMGKWPGKE